MKQTKLPANWSAPRNDIHSDDSAFSDPDITAVKTQLNKWTRVVSREQINNARVRLYDLQNDIDSANTLRQVRSHLHSEDVKPLFDPDSFNKLNYDFSLEKHRLTQTELFQFAEIATQLRKRFRSCHQTEQQHSDLSVLVQSDSESFDKIEVRRQYTRKRDLKHKLKDVGGFERGYSLNKMQLLTKSQMSQTDCLRIFNFWESRRFPMKELGCIFRISTKLASDIVRLYKFQAQKLAADQHKKLLKRQQIQAIHETVLSIQQQGGTIWNVNQVVNSVEATCGL